MDLKKQLEILSYLRSNKVQPTEKNIGLMLILGFEFSIEEDRETPTWYILD